MPMRGLTAIVASADPDRLRAALTLGCAAAALGGRARVYLHEGAVALLRAPDAAVPVGLPTLGDLLDMAAQGGVTVIACQTGLALAGLSADAIGVEAGGLIDLLATLAEDRLVTM